MASNLFFILRDLLLEIRSTSWYEKFIKLVFANSELSFVGVTFDLLFYLVMALRDLPGHTQASGLFVFRYFRESVKTDKTVA